MGHVFLWNGGNGTLSVAADWTDLTLGTVAAAAPGSADSAALVGSANGLVLAVGALDVATLIALGATALSGTVRAGAVLAAGTLVLAPGATLSAATGNITGGVAAEGTGAALQVTGTLSLGGSAAAFGGGRIAAGGMAFDGGTLTVDALSSALVGTGTTATAGTVAIAAGAVLAGAGEIQATDGGIALAGTISAEGGTFGLFAAVTGSGTLQIGAGATLFAADAVGAGLTAAFAAPVAGVGGTLELFGASAGFGATLTGLAVGDAIDVASATIASAAWAHGVLTLTDVFGTTLALALPDSAGHTYDGATFLPLPGGLGGTDVLLAAKAVTAPNANVTLTVAAGISEAFAGTAGAVTRLNVNGLLAVEQHTGTPSTVIAGTLAAVGPSGFFSPGVATVSAGLLTAVGAHATVLVHGALMLSGAFAASGGGWASAGTITLAGGTLTLDAASSMTIGAAPLETGTIAVPAGGTLAGWGRIAAPLDNSGLLLAQGGALVLAAGAGGSGAIGIGAGATLDVLAPLALQVTFNAGATLQLVGAPSLVTGTLSGFAAGDVLDVTGARIDSATWASGTLALASGGATVGTLALAGALAGRSWATAPDGSGGTLVTLGAGGGKPLFVTGTLAVAAAIAAPSATANAGALVEMQGGTLAVGTLTIAAGARLVGAGTVVGAIGDAGTLIASGGALAVTGRIAGAGQIGIAATGTLFAQAGFDPATSLAFQGQGGTLMLFGDASAAPGLIQGFAAGDGIDIAGATVLGATWTATASSAGTLDLTGAAGDLGSLSLAGSYASVSFLAHPDGNGGTLISLTETIAPPPT